MNFLMCIYIYIYTHTHTHTHIHIYIYIYEVLSKDISLYPKQQQKNCYIAMVLQLLLEETIRGVGTPISLLCRNNNMILLNDLATVCKSSSIYHQHYPVGNK